MRLTRPPGCRLNDDRMLPCEALLNRERRRSHHFGRTSMKLPHLLVVCVGVFLLASGRTAADDKKSTEPTEQQIRDAKASFSAIGGRYKAGTHPTTAKTTHTFLLFRATDADLKKLPEVPFPFELYIRDGVTEKVTDAGLEELKNLKNLAGLTLSDTSKVKGEGLKELKGLNNLYHLALDGVPLYNSAAGLENLKELKALKVLSLSGFSWVDDKQFKHIKELKNLEELSLNHVGVTDNGLEHLKELKNLRCLYIMNCGRVTNAGMKHIKKLNSLVELLLDPPMSAAALKELSELKNLKHLRFGGTGVTDAGLKELKGLKGIETIMLFNSQITDAGLKEIKELKNLHTLYFTGPITDAGLKELKEIKSLKSLTIWETQVTDAGLMELRELKNLKSLSLPGAKKVTAEGRKQLQQALPGLAWHN